MPTVSTTTLRGISSRRVRDALGKIGVAVIAVHDNSSPHDVIREHALEKGMGMPIVVDYTDGRILKSWESLGLVRGYPSYVLIDPDGLLLAADNTIPAASLFHSLLVLKNFASF